MKFEIKKAQDTVVEEPTTLELMQIGDGNVILRTSRGDSSQNLMHFKEGKFKRYNLYDAKRLNISVSDGVRMPEDEPYSLAEQQALLSPWLTIPTWRTMP